MTVKSSEALNAEQSQIYILPARQKHQIDK